MMKIRSEFIVMCHRAKELQEFWCPTLGDYFWLGPDYICEPEACRILTDISTSLSLRLSKNKNYVWLPRQDQIQALLGCENDLNENILKELANFYKLYKQEILLSRVPAVTNHIPANELWLMFFMKKRFNKIWDPFKIKWYKDKNNIIKLKENE